MLRKKRTHANLGEGNPKGSPKKVCIFYVHRLQGKQGELHTFLGGSNSMPKIEMIFSSETRLDFLGEAINKHLECGIIFQVVRGQCTVDTGEGGINFFGS